MYNDRVESGEAAGKLPKPEVSIVVDGNRLYKPGMKTVFVEDDQQEVTVFSQPATTTVVGGTYCSCNTVTVCTCNMVCTCEAVCPCVTYVSCPCEYHCECNPMCSCENNCNCDGYSSSSRSSGGGTRTVPCTAPCACVPVH